MIILLTLQGVRSGKGGLEVLSMQICGLSGRKTGLFLCWASCSECVTSLEGWLLNSWLSKPQPLQGWGNPVSPLPPAAGPTGLHPSSATGSVPLPIVVSSMAEQTQSPQPPWTFLVLLSLPIPSRPCSCLGAQQRQTLVLNQPLEFPPFPQSNFFSLPHSVWSEF